jgi:filamentous hemagglutinin family protein
MGNLTGEDKGDGCCGSIRREIDTLKEQTSPTIPALEAPTMLNPGHFRPYWTLGLGWVMLTLLSPVAQAQNVIQAIDGTGTQVNTQVNLTGTQFDITNGTPSGTNRFHSFTRFDLSAGQSANFVLDAGVQNVLGRVTGGTISNINGTITTSGSNANVFLINPSGIVFGPEAQININGSFTATTANGIGFGDQWFHAQGPNNYSLLTLNPTHVGFTMAQPGAIAVGSDLILNAAGSSRICVVL